MIKFLSILLTVVLTSSFLFPYNVPFLAGANSKMILAGIGLILFIIRNVIGTNRAGLNKDLLNLSLLAGLVSLISFASITINGTHDTTFVYYIVSMWVWMGAAYLVLQCIKKIHGELSVELVANYLIGVCVSQCIIALCIDLYEPLKSLAINSGLVWDVKDRLFGIGCALDPAGLRFSGVLIILIYVLSSSKELSKINIFFYILSFIIIVVIGNMMSRTTSVGAIIGLGYLIYDFIYHSEKNTNYKNIFRIGGGILLLSILLILYFYNHNESIHDNIRFGFEGFFSLVETGQWQVHSNDMLKNMVVFPDNLHTWIIGDGYIENPSDSRSLEPYYTGQTFHGYYMNTDIGYLRFIFYFGVAGALSFILLFSVIAQICAKRFPEYRLMFLLVLVMNLVGWLKVSSDIFPVFAIFLVMSMSLENTIEQNSSI